MKLDWVPSCAILKLFVLVPLVWLLQALVRLLGCRCQIINVCLLMFFIDVVFKTNVNTEHKFGVH